MAPKVSKSEIPTIESPAAFPAPQGSDPVAPSPLARPTPAPSPGTQEASDQDSNQTASFLPEDQFKPRAFGRYQLRAILGEGGMGIVFKAYDPQLRRTVALKQIHPGILKRPGDVERFRQEAQAAAQFDHRHIITVHEVGEINGQHYFTMTLASGGMLAKQIDHYRKHPYRAVEFVAKLARAVHYAHGKGVIHRDLKPHNVLIDEHGEPRITDFGLACFINEDTAWSERGCKLGTPAYMSPEQARGNNDEVTPRSDVWALGVILYELMTGKRPFSGPNRKGLTERICSSEPPPLTEIQKGLPRDIETVVRKCLEKDPLDRYASAAELADALEKWLASEPWLSRVGQIWRRRPLRTLTAAVLLASLGTMSVLYAAGVVRLDPRRQERSDFPTDEDGQRVVEMIAKGPTTLIGETGPPRHYWKYQVDATGRTPLTTPPQDKLRLLTTQRMLLELAPNSQDAGFIMSARIQHQGGDPSKCGIYFGHKMVPRGNRTEHWYWSFQFAELGTFKGKAWLTAYYCHEPLSQPTRLNQRLKEWQTTVDSVAFPPKWHDLALAVSPMGITVTFDTHVLWTKTHAELVAEAVPLPLREPRIIQALDPPFPTPREAPPVNGWGGFGLHIETGEASFCNVVVGPPTKR